MIETIQGQPAQGGPRSAQTASQAKGGGERHSSGSFMLEGAVGPRGRDAHGQPGKGAAQTGDPAAAAGTAPRDPSGKVPGTFVAGLVNLDDAEAILLGRPASISDDADPASGATAAIDQTVGGADDATPELVAGLTEGGEADASTGGIAPTLPAPEAATLSLSLAKGEIDGAPTGLLPKDPAKLAAPTTSAGAAGAKGAAATSGIADPALQTAAAQADPRALRDAVPLRQATATFETARPSAASADGGSDGADTLASARPVSQMTQGAAAIERPAVSPAAVAPTAEAAQQAAARGTIDEALEEVQADRLAAQPQARASAPSRAGVDHLALGRMYAPPGATPVRDFAMQVSRKVASGATRFQIRLDPPELGRVDVSLEMKGDNATLRLVVERSETLDFLARDARTLERALQDAGVKADAGEMEFSLGQDGGKPSDRDADDRSRSRPVATSDDALSDGPRIRSVRADALVDLVI